jgi:predicted NBD/HSP70 family sugar kinase
MKTIGVGVGLVLNGRVYQGSRGLTEGGHMIITSLTTGRKCSCGQIGTYVRMH